jgi:hypothetical protein
MITVKVISEYSGEPAKNQKVALYLDYGILTDGVTSYEYTDTNGEVDFDYKPANGKVYVNGNTVHEGYLSGRVVVYI